jgi:hypothetical protein
MTLLSVSFDELRYSIDNASSVQEISDSARRSSTLIQWTLWTSMPSMRVSGFIWHLSSLRKKKVWMGLLPNAGPVSPMSSD